MPSVLLLLAVIRNIINKNHRLRINFNPPSKLDPSEDKQSKGRRQKQKNKEKEEQSKTQQPAIRTGSLTLKPEDKTKVAVVEEDDIEPEEIEVRMSGTEAKEKEKEQLKKDLALLNGFNITKEEDPDGFLLYYESKAAVDCAIEASIQYIMLFQYLRFNPLYIRAATCNLKQHLLTIISVAILQGVRNISKYHLLDSARRKLENAYRALNLKEKAVNVTDLTISRIVQAWPDLVVMMAFKVHASNPSVLPRFGNELPPYLQFQGAATFLGEEDFKKLKIICKAQTAAFNSGKKNFDMDKAQIQTEKILDTIRLTPFFSESDKATIRSRLAMAV